MPVAEVRPWMFRGGVQTRAGGFGGRYTSSVVAGSGIFRGLSLSSPAVAADRVLSPEENKENIPPPQPPRVEGGTPGSRSRRKPKRRSPLPEWHPRSPLQDITSIVLAMEKRRTRLRAVAAARRSESSSSPLQQESGGSPLDQPLSSAIPADESVSPGLSSFASPPPSVEQASGISEDTNKAVVLPKALESSDSLPQDSLTSQSTQEEPAAGVIVSTAKAPVAAASVASTAKAPAVAVASSAPTEVRRQISAPGKNLVDHIDVIKKLIRDEELRKKAAGTVKSKPAKRSTLSSMR